MIVREGRGGRKACITARHKHCGHAYWAGKFKMAASGASKFWRSLQFRHATSLLRVGILSVGEIRDSWMLRCLFLSLFRGFLTYKLCCRRGLQYYISYILQLPCIWFGWSNDWWGTIMLRWNLWLSIGRTGLTCPMFFFLNPSLEPSSKVKIKYDIFSVVLLLRFVFAMQAQQPKVRQQGSRHSLFIAG